MNAPAMKYLGRRPKYEICLMAYEIRSAYEILALWANMMVLADANIPIRLPHPRSGPINGGESLFA